MRQPSKLLSWKNALPQLRRDNGARLRLDQSFSRLLLLTLLLTGSSLFAGCYVDTPPASPDSASGFLVGLLRDPNPDVRRTAVEALGKIGSEIHGHEIIQAWSDPDARVREAAVIAMSRLEPRPDSARLLAQALTDSSETVRRAAARSFGELPGTPDIWQPIIPLLKNPDPLRRRTAAHALMQLDLTEVGASLSRAANDPDLYVRQVALAALGESGTVGAVAMLRHSLLYDPAPEVRAEAAYRLGKIGTEQVIGELKQVAATDRDQIVRRWARWASEELTRLPGSG